MRQMPHDAGASEDAYARKDIKKFEFEDLAGYEQLYNAHLETRKGRRYKSEVAIYDYRMLEATLYLEWLLKSGRYHPGEKREFFVYEPKKRLVVSYEHKDKVVQRSYCDNVFKPRVAPRLILDNYASQEGKGVEFGLKRLKKMLVDYYSKNGTNKGAILKGDIHHYFASMKHSEVKKQTRELYEDERIIKLQDMTVDSWYSKEETVDMNDKRGLPLGLDSSQMWGVVMLDPLDHYIKEVLHIKYYGRYMDDFFLIHEDAEYLKECRIKIEEFVGKLGLKTNNKTQIFPLRHGIDFLGFHTYLKDSGKVVMKLRQKKKRNYKRKLRKLKVKVEKGERTFETVSTSYQSWRAHAKRGNCHYLIQEMDCYFYTLFYNYISPEEKMELAKIKRNLKKKPERRNKNVKTIK